MLSAPSSWIRPPPGRVCCSSIPLDKVQLLTQPEAANLRDRRDLQIQSRRKSDLRSTRAPANVFLQAARAAAQDGGPDGDLPQDSQPASDPTLPPRNNGERTHAGQEPRHRPFPSTACETRDRHVVISANL